MNKPLKDWTLGEIKTECVKRNAFCKANGKCPFFALQGKGSYCKIEDKVGGAVPSYWDLSEPPRWTEQDKEDAKAIKRIFPDATYLKRQDCFCEDVTVFSKSHSGVAHLNANLVPSLSMDELVTIDEIIGGGK